MLSCRCRSHYQRRRGGGPINRFNPATWLCLSQVKICISYAICHGLFIFNSLRWERRLFAFLILMELLTIAHNISKIKLGEILVKGIVLIIT